jgi:hypothetical protein
MEAVSEGLLRKQMPSSLPISALTAFCPMMAALILTYRENGSSGAKELLKRSFDYKRIRRKIWYVPIFFLMPVIMALGYGWMKVMRVSIPDFQFRFY